MIELLVPLAIFAGYLYLFSTYYRRFPYKPVAGLRVLSFAGGCLMLALVLASPFDALADRSFTWHMAQHLVLMFVAPPLLLLGAPLLYFMGTLPRSVALAVSHALHAQPLSTLFAPVTGWLLFVGVVWITHFSPLYNWALENSYVHLAEHGLYITAALLFWSHIVDPGLTIHPLSFPARMLYIFLAVPQGAFLGMVLVQSRYALYAHYRLVEPGIAALADQHNGGALMWIGGGMILFSAFMLCAATWAVREQTPEMEYTH